MRPRLPAALGVLLLLAACAGQTQTPAPSLSAGPSDHTAHETVEPSSGLDPDQHSNSMRLIATLPNEDHSDDFANSDFAFWGDLAVQGSYDGFRIIDISDPEQPSVLADVTCRGPQGDVSIWEHLIIVSVDRPQTVAGCDSEDAADVVEDDPSAIPASGAWEGLRIFDASRPTSPDLVASVFTDCGSHTHTLLPDPDNGRLVIYVESYALREEEFAPECANPHGHISIVEVPIADPASAQVVAQPAVPDTAPWGLPSGAPADFHDTTGCHDISIFRPLRLAAAACLSDGQIWDISDPLNPRTLAHVDQPEVFFWHSAAWSNDGTVVAFGDENLTDAGCADAPAGAIWFYTLTDPASPQLAGRFNLPRTQGEVVCSAHMFNVVPGIERDILVSAFYAGGTSVIDFTNPAAPQEIAFYDVGGAQPSDQWSAYWYRGHVYASDHHRGLDVFALDWPDLAGASVLPYLNPQTQE
jgi:hypothetical protein